MLRFKTVIFGRQKSEELDSDELRKVRGLGRELGIRNNTTQFVRVQVLGFLAAENDGFET